jgi:hypothetical protein
VHAAVAGIEGTNMLMCVALLLLTSFKQQWQQQHCINAHQAEVMLTWHEDPTSCC